MTTLSRRDLLKVGALTGASLFLPAARATAFQAVPLRRPPTLDPTTVPKYVAPLVVPPAMPLTGRVAGGSIDAYVIGVQQFRQQVLPAPAPTTRVWSYASQTRKGTAHFPAFTIEAGADRPVRVTWVNGLVDATGRYLPHLLPVDPTLHWANPPGGVADRDSHPMFSTTPGPYTGPVPIVTHLHGANAHQESDGFAEAWYLPDAKGIPRSYARVGSAYDELHAAFADRYADSWQSGEAKAQYDNDQAASTLWFHDHTLGMTRLNVYAGPAGFYLIRGGPHDLPAGVLPGPAPARDDAPGTAYYEIPLAIQDRSFDADGALFYPDTRAYFDGFTGPYSPDSDIAPIWNPEFFGHTMLVNGHTWPDLRVERRRYRFRVLNGCNSRFLILKLASDPLAERPVTPVAQFWQIGAEGGFLDHPVATDRLLLAPAERADVVVDFSQFTEAQQVYLVNEAPDEPFGGGEPDEDFDAADPFTTGQVMRFSVVDAAGTDSSTPPDQLTLPAVPTIPPSTRTRRLALLEADSEVLDDVGPRAAFLATVGEDGVPVARNWDDPVTETPTLGDVETWEIDNRTADAHPIHVHLVQFAVAGRESAAGEMPPEPTESGLKDTVIAYPGEVTRIRARFDKPGRFVWHCHIVEHEDHEMMRTFTVLP
jgi:bilirubin oxidase